MTYRAKIIGAAKWAGVIAFGFAMAWTLNWNEFDSPWGRATQAAKMEHLKRTICK